MGVGEPGAPLLVAEGLIRRYGARRVVAVDRLGVAPGEVLAVLGPNGAGKSTLFRLLAGVERPDAGRVRLDGRELGRGDREAERRMAAVFQRPHLFAGTVRSNVEYGLRARGVPRTERSRRATEALEWLGIAELARAPVGTLSGGEAHRVALARALVIRPDVLLLDEPTAGLDILSRRSFRRELEHLVRARAGSAILVTHDPEDAFAVADRIAVMEGGRLVQTGTPEELTLRPASAFVAAFAGAELLLDGVLRGWEDGLARVDLGNGFVLLAAGEAGGPVLPAGARVHIAYRPEDVVLAVPGEAGQTSARNRFTARVGALTPAGAFTRVRIDGPVPLVALITRGSAERLRLGPGREVVAQLKATALRAFPVAGRDAVDG